MLRAGFKPGSLSEHLLEFDTCSKPLGHHGRFSTCFIPLRFADQIELLKIARSFFTVQF